MHVNDDCFANAGHSESTATKMFDELYGVSYKDNFEGHDLKVDEINFTFLLC